MTVTRDRSDNCFYIDARGDQECVGAAVEIDEGRATITLSKDGFLVPDLSSPVGIIHIGGITLTKIQTEELTLWLMRQLMREF